ncbi:hypothetical protein KIL84_021072 [Mauremys mutica]|uniref:Uncharacterized protein n=1 Tax=Mauremys mutica TaxID=74926 RepID=A0A9D4AZM4_9SAUR|nr:hypothetical protein KIL84_021072 [Mauremys mutica]
MTRCGIVPSPRGGPIWGLVIRESLEGGCEHFLISAASHAQKQNLPATAAALLPPTSVSSHKRGGVRGKKPTQRQESQPQVQAAAPQPMGERRAQLRSPGSSGAGRAPGTEAAVGKVREQNFPLAELAVRETQRATPPSHKQHLRPHPVPPLTNAVTIKPRNCNSASHQCSCLTVITAPGGHARPSHITRQRHAKEPATVF